MCLFFFSTSVLTVNWKPMPKLNNKVVENQGLDRFFRSCLGGGGIRVGKNILKVCHRKIQYIRMV